MRLSGLQKEVLSLYRTCLRESRKKPAATRPHFESFIRSEFEKSIKIDKRDFTAIEFLLRKGRRQLETYSAPGIKDIREPQRQRRISRKKNGIRVSRRLPSRGTGESASGDRQYPLMQVPEFTEDHPYWGTLRQSQIHDPTPGPANAIENEGSYENCAQVQTLGGGNLLAPEPEEASRKFRGRRRKGMSVIGRSRGKAKEKRFGLADPVVWDAINRTLVQQRQLSTIVLPEDIETGPLHLLEVPSRTSSQRKALNRFTRQLEKYADAAGAAGKVPVTTPTESESKVSYHTIQPLLPYQKEFQAAGLAVTSAEQSRMSPAKAKSNQAPIDRPTGYAKAPGRINAELDGQDEAYSEQPGSSSGTFVEFTPIGHPIESLPRSKAKSKGKLLSKEKGRLLPWLKRKPPAEEPHDSRLESQRTRQPTEDNRVQTRVKTIYPQHREHHNRFRGYRTRLSGAHETAATKPVTHSSKQVHSLLDPTNLGKSPGRKPGPAESKQDNHVLSSRPEASMADPELGARQRATHTGLRKRDVAVARLPLPETIEEEKETPATCVDQTKIQIYPRPGSADAPISTAETSLDQHAASPQTTPSSVPSLPSAARYAISRGSSLERALDEVSQQLEKMEREAENSTQMYSRPPTLVDKTNRKEQHASPRHSGQRRSGAALSRVPRPAEEIIFVDRKMPPIKSPSPKSKRSSLSPPKPPRKSPARKPPSPQRKLRTPSPPKEKTLPKIPQTEDGLKDLDVFFDYDDADISDRDVIRGLQVAIHAAADNVYDAMIRERTGLRIRRFLADLRAVGEMHQETPATTQRAPARPTGLRKPH